MIDKTPIPGFCLESIEIDNVLYNCWDTGGSDRILQRYYDYYKHADGVIYVIDCNDHERI